MEINMKVIGKIIKEKDMEYIIFQMVVSLKAIRKMIRKMINLIIQIKKYLFYNNYLE